MHYIELYYLQYKKKRAIVNFQTLSAMMANYIFVVLDFFILHSHISCVTASGNAYFDGNCRCWWFRAEKVIVRRPMFEVRAKLKLLHLHCVVRVHI